MQLTLTKKAILLTVGIIGIVVPFVPYLTVIEMFFLLTPFAVIFVTTLIYLIASLINKNLDRGKAIFIFSMLPLFVLAQLMSTFTVDRIQRFKSEKVIQEVEEHRAKAGELPEKIETPFGITYLRMNDKANFIISYSKGFMVTEKYYSKYSHWRSYGWND